MRPCATPQLASGPAPRNKGLSQMTARRSGKRARRLRVARTHQLSAVAECARGAGRASSSSSRGERFSTRRGHSSNVRLLACHSFAQCATSTVRGISAEDSTVILYLNALISESTRLNSSCTKSTHLIISGFPVLDCIGIQTYDMERYLISLQLQEGRKF